MTKWIGLHVVLGQWDQLLLPFLERVGSCLSHIDVAVPNRRSETKTPVVAKWEDRCFACLQWRPTKSQLQRNTNLRFHHVHIFAALQVHSSPRCPVDVRRKTHPSSKLRSVRSRSQPTWHKGWSRWPHCQVSNPDETSFDMLKLIWILYDIIWYYTILHYMNLYDTDWYSIMIHCDTLWSDQINTLATVSATYCLSCDWGSLKRIFKRWCICSSPRKICPSQSSVCAGGWYAKKPVWPIIARSLAYNTCWKRLLGQNSITNVYNPDRVNLKTLWRHTCCSNRLANLPKEFNLNMFWAFLG